MVEKGKGDVVSERVISIYNYKKAELLEISYCILYVVYTELLKNLTKEHLHKHRCKIEIKYNLIVMKR